jgi:hypothetical protein
MSPENSQTQETTDVDPVERLRSRLPQAPQTPDDGFSIEQQVAMMEARQRNSELQSALAEEYDTLSREEVMRLVQARLEDNLAQEHYLVRQAVIRQRDREATEQETNAQSVQHEGPGGKAPSRPSAPANMQDATAAALRAVGA